MEKELKEREEKSEYFIDLLVFFEWNFLKNFFKIIWFWFFRSMMKGNENYNDFVNVLNCINRVFIMWKFVLFLIVIYINDLFCNIRCDKFFVRVIKVMVYKSIINIFYFVVFKCWE